MSEFTSFINQILYTYPSPSDPCPWGAMALPADVLPKAAIAPSAACLAFNAAKGSLTLILV